MEIRDPIHGFIQLNDSEAGIINQPSFQRLRRISQLAMTYLVYPGAVHSRFDHSIGVMHVAGRISQRLVDNEDERKYIRLAALLHDIGHGPFSHVSEEPFAEVNKEWLAETGVAKDKIHEVIGLQVIEKMFLGTGLLTRREFDEIENLLTSADLFSGSINKDIVSGPLDADKIDYLLRDSYYCGVKYGLFDIERLIRALIPAQKDSHSRLVVDLEDIAATDQFLIARHNMHTQVYKHKTRIATNLMLGRAIMAAVSSGDTNIRTAYTYDPSDPEFLDRFLDFDDRELLRRLEVSEINTSKKLALALKNRHLPSRLVFRPLSQIADTERRLKLQDKEKCRAELDSIRIQISGVSEKMQDSDFLFVEVINEEFAGKFLKKENKEEAIWVYDGKDLKPLLDHSLIFRNFGEYQQPYLAVYVRPNIPQDKQKLATMCTEVIGIREEIFEQSEPE